MPDGFIEVKVNDHGLSERLAQLPDKVAERGVELANLYIEKQANSYANAAPYNYVSYESIGGFVSDRQRRYVMANIREGNITIPYPRATKDRYYIEGSGRAQKVVSDDVSMYYSQDTEGQTQMQMLRGWGRMDRLLQAWGPDILRHFEAGVGEAIEMLELERWETLHIIPESE